MTISETRENHILNMGGKGTQDFNCWGATQYVLNARNSLGWVEFPEMSLWLMEKTETVQQPEVGDILALFGRTPIGKILVHTAVYLGGGEYLHKLGMNRAEKATLRQVRNHYKGCHNGYEIRRLKCD